MKNIKRIATLGPPGTFSDAATSKYAATQDDPYEVVYFPTIGSGGEILGTSYSLAILEQAERTDRPLGSDKFVVEL